MNNLNLATVAPFIRYAIMIVGGMFLPDNVVAEMTNDEVLIEALAGGFLIASGAVWYLYSRSRRAVVEKFGGPR